MVAPSDSDPEGSDSEAPSDSQADQQSQDGDGASEHDSDLGDFIVDDDPAADARGPEEGVRESGPSANEVSALLEEAGMVSSRTDKEHFTIYIEYLVYDLVDNTFAVRVMGDSRLRKHFDVAVRHVEESLAFKRCAAPFPAGNVLVLIKPLYARKVGARRLCDPLLQHSSAHGQHLCGACDDHDST